MILMIMMIIQRPVKEETGG